MLQSIPLDQLWKYKFEATSHAGFTRYVRAYACADKRYYIRGIDTGTYPVGSLPVEYSWGTLTDEQQKIMELIDIHREAVIDMKTARGKSYLISAIIAKKRVKTLVLCHNLDTVADVYARIRKLTTIHPDSISMISSKHWSEMADIVVTTHKTFTLRWKEFKEYGYEMVLYDECHKNLSFPKGRDFNCMNTNLIDFDPLYLYGLSGTPYQDNLGKEALLLLYKRILKVEGQENNGYNMLPSVQRFVYKTNTRYAFEHFSELVELMINDEERTAAIVEAISSNLRTFNLVLVDRVIEVEQMYSKLASKFVSWGNLLKFHWQLSAKEYKQEEILLEEFVSENIPFTIVASIDKFGTGVDVPPIDTIFLCAQVKFQGTVIQAVGRWLRKHPLKKDVLLYDWVDQSILYKQGYDRKVAYIKEYGNIPITDIKFLPPDKK